MTLPAFATPTARLPKDAWRVLVDLRGNSLRRGRYRLAWEQTAIDEGRLYGVLATLRDAVVIEAPRRTVRVPIKMIPASGTYATLHLKNGLFPFPCGGVQHVGVVRAGADDLARWGRDLKIWPSSLPPERPGSPNSEANAGNPSSDTFSGLEGVFP